MLSGHTPIEAVSEALGIDFKAEIAAITTDVPMGTTVARAVNCVALVVLLNDVSLGGLIPAELARGFGFYQSKPATSFVPVAITPVARGSARRDAMLHLVVRIELNGSEFGNPNAGGYGVQLWEDHRASGSDTYVVGGEHRRCRNDQQR